MSSSWDISQVANILRSCSSAVCSGKRKLCLSTNYLCKLNNVIEENDREDGASSFHIVETSNSKTNRIRDIHFLLDLFQKTVHLKINPDVTNDFTNVDIRRFKNLRTLEIHKLDLQTIVGIQKLRSQLQELVCCYCLKTLSDVLDKCGADNSQRYGWRELKKANFSHNEILELDDSLGCTLSLHTLDLSHNNLSHVNFRNQLPNLKYLNLSYNKLFDVPNFKGQICNRLQALILNNNFIEDVTGLTALANLVQLDLSQNSLLDHKLLLSISHLISLQYFSLQGNPLSFHPNHRVLSCSYLNKNASSLKFLLDGSPLNKTEKGATGSLYPVLPTRLSGSSNHSLDSSIGSVQEKPKRVRNVTIEDEGEDVVKEVVPVLTPSKSSQHLAIKRQVEQLREEYGESWLYRDSGLLVQDVLGFEKSSILSSTPYELAIDTLCMPDSYEDRSKYETAAEDQSKEDFKTAVEDSIFSSAARPEDEASDISDSEDIFSGGEECIYLATNKTNENETQVFVVLTERHISERDANTSKEKARWHINTIIECEKIESNVVKLIFDTVRRDRKQRVYELEQSETDSFYATIKEKLNTEKVEEKRISYQCMKCSHTFSRKSENVLRTEVAIECRKCGSNLVVESS